MTESERFYRRVALGDDGCLIWTGATRRGYGVFRSGGRLTNAHRWAWGRVPPGHKVATCPKDKRCVNVGHLQLYMV